MNMSYCRFRNTLAALRECHQHMDDADLSEGEREARTSLLKLCATIAGDYEEPSP